MASSPIKPEIPAFIFIGSQQSEPCVPVSPLAVTGPVQLHISGPQWKQAAPANYIGQLGWSVGLVGLQKCQTNRGSERSSLNAEPKHQVSEDSPNGATGRAPRGPSWVAAPCSPPYTPWARPSWPSLQHSVGKFKAHLFAHHERTVCKDVFLKDPIQVSFF